MRLQGISIDAGFGMLMIPIAPACRNAFQRSPPIGSARPEPRERRLGAAQQDRNFPLQIESSKVVIVLLRRFLARILQRPVEPSLRQG